MIQQPAFSLCLLDPRSLPLPQKAAIADCMSQARRRDNLQRGTRQILPHKATTAYFVSYPKKLRQSPKRDKTNSATKSDSATRAHRWDVNRDLLWGLMKEAAGDGIWIPRDWGEGVGTNDPGEGTWRWGLPGELAPSSVPGEGVPISAAGEAPTWDGRDGGEARGKAAAGDG